MKQVSWLFSMVAIFSIALAGQSISALAHSADYKVLENVVYGKGVIGFSGEPTPRELLLDAYIPVQDEGRTLKPAIILAFGGVHFP